MKGGISKRISVISYDASQCYRDLSREQKEYIWMLCLAHPLQWLWLMDIHISYGMFSINGQSLPKHEDWYGLIYTGKFFICVMYFCVFAQGPVSYLSSFLPKSLNIKTPIPSTQAPTDPFVLFLCCLASECCN